MVKDRRVKKFFKIGNIAGILNGIFMGFIYSKFFFMTKFQVFVFCDKLTGFAIIISRPKGFDNNFPGLATTDFTVMVQNNSVLFTHN